MDRTIACLAHGRAEIVQHFESAHRLWLEILNDNEGLAMNIQSYQTRFERECGGRWLGQEVMVLSAFGRCLDERGEPINIHMAERLASAFEDSFASLEVKGLARRVARALFDLPRADDD